MAVTTTPWGYVLGAAADSVAGPLTIKCLFWVGDDGSNLDIADNDQLDLHDNASGNLILSKKAGTSEDGLELVLTRENWIHIPTGKSLYVTTMAGGILIIWV